MRVHALSASPAPALLADQLASVFCFAGVPKNSDASQNTNTQSYYLTTLLFFFSLRENAFEYSTSPILVTTK